MMVRFLSLFLVMLWLVAGCGGGEKNGTPSPEEKSPPVTNNDSEEAEEEGPGPGVAPEIPLPPRLKWTPPPRNSNGDSTKGEVLNYRVHVGNESRNYFQSTDAGSNLFLSLADLDITPGVYYLAVTAYNGEGESPYSEEIVVAFD